MSTTRFLSRGAVALTALFLLCAALPAAAGFLRGVGGLGIGSDGDVQTILTQLKPRGFNHVQAWFNAADPKTPGRLRTLHAAGITVFDYSSAFIDQPNLESEYQIRADGSVKSGTVCPRSQVRLDQMVQRSVAAARAGGDGIIWDFITVESRELEACFCPKCLAALNAALGKSLSREQAVSALKSDPAALAVWRKVREESTTSALRYVCDRVDEQLGERSRGFSVGGYVLMPGSDLGMDTGAMYKSLDVGAPMIYQATDPAPLGWMLGALKGFQALGGKARNVVCIDTGFFVKEPWQELVATCFDCIRGKADGYALWPFATVGADDLEAMAVLNKLDELVYAPARGEAAALTPAAGLRRFAALYRAQLDAPSRQSLETLTAGVATDAGQVYSESFAQAIFKVVCAVSEASQRDAHRTDLRIDLPPYRVQLTADGGQLAVATEDWALAQGAIGENVDEVVYRDLFGNAANGNANLGLLRVRVRDWFDGWGAHNVTKVVDRGRDHVTILTTVSSDTCEIGRTLTLRRGDPMIEAVISVRNLDSKPHKGRLWLWNGFGIPGYLEQDPGSPWVDDKRERTGNTVTVSDEGCHLSISADRRDWELGAFGGDGCSHAFRNLNLQPGQVFRTPLKLRLWRD